MKRKIIVFFPIIVVSLSLIYFYGVRDSRKELDGNKTFANIQWPAGTKYELTKDGDLILELKEKFKAIKGEWGRGTRFYLDGNEISKIETKGAFKFAQMSFYQKTMITVETFPPNILHKLQLNEAMLLDGLDVKKNCIISFKNYVLFSADCPGLDTLYFKRFIELPEASSFLTAPFKWAYSS